MVYLHVPSQKARGASMLTQVHMLLWPNQMRPPFMVNTTSPSNSSRKVWVFARQVSVGFRLCMLGLCHQRGLRDLKVTSPCAVKSATSFRESAL